jgi:hypothetical protein
MPQYPECLVLTGHAWAGKIVIEMTSSDSRTEQLVRLKIEERATSFAHLQRQFIFNDIQKAGHSARTSDDVEEAPSDRKNSGAIG